jgi:NRPS condensation-like uncharacterized protein
MNAILRHVCDQQLHIVMEFQTRLDEKVLERAVRHILLSEPELGWRWVEIPRPVWRTRKNLDSLPLFMLVESTDPQEELGVFLTTPSDPGADPLLQVRLFRGKDDILALKVNHVVCDGIGAKELAYHLSEVYGHLLRNETLSVPSRRPHDRSMRPIWRRLDLSKRWRMRRTALKAIRKSVRPTSQWCLPFTSRETKSRRMLLKRFDSFRSESIIGHCHSIKVTINDLFLAVLFESLFEIIRPKQGVSVPIQVAVDLRRFAPEAGQKVANLGGALFPLFSVDDASDHEKFLLKVHQFMEVLKQNDSALVSVPFIEMTYGLLPFALTKRKVEEGYEEMVKRRSLPPLFSNVGVLEEGRLHFGDIIPSDCYLTVPLAYPPLLIIGLSSYQGRFTLSIGFCSYGTDKKDIDRLFDLMDSKLPK